MRLLLDQDVYAATAQFLVASGHDVVQAAQFGLSRATDEQMLPSTQGVVHRELARMPQLYSEKELRRVFVVIEADGHSPAFGRQPRAFIALQGTSGEVLD